MPPTPLTIIFQSAKLENPAQILDELTWAESLDSSISHRIYGISGGALVALAYALRLMAQQDPTRCGAAATAFNDIRTWLLQTNSDTHTSYHTLNLNPWHGFFNLNPLRAWIRSQLKVYFGDDSLRFSDLPLSLYLCAADGDGVFTVFGKPLDELQFQYHAVRVGPPQDAPIANALIAALSTGLSTEPALVNGSWYHDCRPAIVDGGALVADLQHNQPMPILRRRPYTPLRNWKLNWITSSFIMHAQHERNHTLLAECYLNLLDQHRTLQKTVATFQEDLGLPSQPDVKPPLLHHIDLPYIGSTEAATNMRQSAENKPALMYKFSMLLDGQCHDLPCDHPANIIYGAGGFSGILAGLVTTRAIERGFLVSGGSIRQIYGVSAGVINGFFHAVQVAAQQFPDLYHPAAQHALEDLEDFFSLIEPKRILRINRDPRNFWQGWANLQPLEAFLEERLAAYTASQAPSQITFDDIALPLTVSASRGDGFVDFLGMSFPERSMQFCGHEIKVQNAPVIKAILAGWSMNTYIQPQELNGEHYRDGGGTFYDIGFFAACLDEKLTHLINIHLDEPEEHSYGIPPRPNLLRLAFDTHNYTFPEERRRMRLLTDLLFEHARLREVYSSLITRLPQDSVHRQNILLPSDFLHHWDYPGEQPILHMAFAD